MHLLPLVTMGMAAPEMADHEPDTPTSVEITLEVVDGALVATPDPAFVRKGGTITWHTAEGDSQPFTVVPKVGWRPIGQASGADNHFAIASRAAATGISQRVEAQAGHFPGRFPYGVIIAGKNFDPDVVIKPR